MAAPCCPVLPAKARCSLFLHSHFISGPAGTRARPLTSSRARPELVWDGDCGDCPRAGRVAPASVWPLQPGRRWLLRKAPALGDGGTRLGGTAGWSGPGLWGSLALGRTSSDAFPCLGLAVLDGGIANRRRGQWPLNLWRRAT